MARYTGALLKKCRALGIEPQVIGINKKSNRQVKRSFRKPSEYALQLREKQKVRFIYGVLEKPFRNLYERAVTMKGATGENLVQLLERRLDNVVYRAGFAATRAQARQMVNHSHFLVNGKKVNIPSYTVKENDEITVRAKSKNSTYFKAVKESGFRIVPKWLQADKEELKATVVELPAREDLDFPLQENMIVEFYSR
ncbi:MAG TPA: 30S ribosomal protein S4 [Clostridiales bacterium]|jgi:small subunit ribosomal protein S4|nr:30S ribosomal protein S4 [Clostridiales bacterium]